MPCSVGTEVEEAQTNDLALGVDLFERLAVVGVVVDGDTTGFEDV